MILDERTEFADAVAVAGAAATYNVGDVIDSGTVTRDLGNGEPLYVVIQVVTAPAGATTVEFKLVSDAVATPAVDGSATVHWSSGTKAIAAVPAGTTYIFDLPSGVTYERYLGVQETNVGAGALTALVVNAFLTPDKHGWVSYPDASN